MARNEYTCVVCGKVLTIAGPRNIELHEKSKFHIAAMNNKKEKVLDQAPESEPINEIKTTVLENNNGKNKDTKGREDSGDSGDDDGWDGYLC